MKYFFIFMICCASVVVGIAAQAQNPVYLCEKNGIKEYKNTGDTKGCKKVDLPALTVASPYRAVPMTNSTNSAATMTPRHFPKVDQDTQKRRDEDRRQILQVELTTEQKKLADLQRIYNNGEPERQGNEHNYAKYQERVATLQQDINRVQHNVDALNRELMNVK